VVSSKQRREREEKAEMRSGLAEVRQKGLLFFMASLGNTDVKGPHLKHSATSLFLNTGSEESTRTNSDATSDDGLNG